MLLSVAVSGQLNRVVEAANDIVHLQQLKPNFEREAFFLINRYVKEEDLVAHIMDGLRKAGMAL